MIARLVIRILKLPENFEYGTSRVALVFHINSQEIQQCIMALNYFVSPRILAKYENYKNKTCIFELCTCVVYTVSKK